MNFPDPVKIATNGIELSVHIAGPKTGLPVLLLHGWPELARSWQHQFAALASAGFYVIAPDMRGFGGSDAPRAVSAYGIDILLADMIGLLDVLDIEEAIWAGHDWGGFIAWPAALLVNSRVAGVIGVNTPHAPRAPADPVELLRQKFGEDHYIVRFQETGLAEAALEGREEAFFEFIFAAPPARPFRKIPAKLTHLLQRFSRFTAKNKDGILDAKPDQNVVPEKERKIFASTYKKSGFTGGMNYYRNLSANWRRMKGVDYQIDNPCLMVGAQCDLFLPPAYMDNMETRCSDLEKHVIAGCGHWTQWEAPEELSQLMISWLSRRFG